MLVAMPIVGMRAFFSSRARSRGIASHYHRQLARVGWRARPCAFKCGVQQGVRRRIPSLGHRWALSILPHRGVTACIGCSAAVAFAEGH